MQFSRCNIHIQGNYIQNNKPKLCTADPVSDETATCV